MDHGTNLPEDVPSPKFLENSEAGDEHLILMIGEAVLSIRKARRMTLKQLGDAIGRSGALISNIEKGKTEVGVPTLFRISQILEVPLRTLLPDLLLEKLQNGSH